jgi:hypothetical protein
MRELITKVGLESRTVVDPKKLKTELELADPLKA